MLAWLCPAWTDEGETGTEGQKGRTKEDEVQGSRKDVYDSIIASRYPSVILLPTPGTCFLCTTAVNYYCRMQTHTHLHTPTQERVVRYLSRNKPLTPSCTLWKSEGSRPRDTQAARCEARDRDAGRDSIGNTLGMMESHPDLPPTRSSCLHHPSTLSPAILVQSTPEPDVTVILLFLSTVVASVLKQQAW